MRYVVKHGNNGESERSRYAYETSLPNSIFCRNSPIESEYEVLKYRLPSE